MTQRVSDKYASLTLCIATAAAAACGSSTTKSTNAVGSASSNVAVSGSGSNIDNSGSGGNVDNSGSGGNVDNSGSGSNVGSAGAVAISVSSIHLADDCGKPANTAPPTPGVVTPTPPRAYAVPGRASQRPCDQSVLQLQLVAAATATATTIAIHKIELLNNAGSILGELTSRSPKQWLAAGKYAAWDQKIAGGATIKASYALSAPLWPSYGLTRAAAAKQTYRLRVTVTTNGNEQVVTGQATVVSPPTPIQPSVPT